MKIVNEFENKLFWVFHFLSEIFKKKSWLERKKLGLNRICSIKFWCNWPIWLMRYGQRQPAKGRVCGRGGWRRNQRHGRQWRVWIERVGKPGSVVAPVTDWWGGIAVESGRLGWQWRIGGRARCPWKVSHLHYGFYDLHAASNRFELSGRTSRNRMFSFFCWPSF